MRSHSKSFVLIRFDASFLDRRMREHQEWQQRTTEESANEIICEVEEAFARESEYGNPRIVRSL
jgi:hypothetical protein